MALTFKFKHVGSHTSYATRHLNSLSQNRARAMWLCIVVLTQAMGGMGEDVKLKDGGAVPAACDPAAAAAATAARAWAI